MDVPEEDTNSPGWVFKPEGGLCAAPVSAAQDGEGQR